MLSDFLSKARNRKNAKGSVSKSLSSSTNSALAPNANADGGAGGGGGDEASRARGRRYTVVQQEKFVQLLKQAETHKRFSLTAGRKRSLTELQRSMKTSLGVAIRPKREGRVFEHFIVAGCPPGCKVEESPSTPRSSSSSSTPSSSPSSSLSSSQLPSSSPSGSSPLGQSYTRVTGRPSVLFKFPIEKELINDQTPHFCFPSGIPVVDVDPGESAGGGIGGGSSGGSGIGGSGIEGVFGGLDRLEHPDNSHVFLMTGGETVLYGVCVSRMEFIDTNPHFIPGECAQSTTNGNATEENGHRRRVAMRCYCLLTRFPFFKLHFKVLYKLIALERDMALSKLRGEAIDTENNNVLALLHEYYNCHIDEHISEINLKIPTVEEPATFPCVEGTEEEQIAEWGLASICRNFSPVDFVLILRALLLEFKVIVICESLGTLSSIMYILSTSGLRLACIPVMRPFLWQGAFIPVLPSYLEECLETPVPYVMGVQSLSQERISNVEDCLMLDVLQKNLSVPKIFPALPGEDELKRKLKAPFSVFQPSKLSQDRFSKLLRRPAEAPKPEQDAIRDILQILRDYYSVLLEKITSRMDGPNVNFSDEPAVDQLVAKFPDPEQEFFYHLFHTQMFAVFSDHLLRLMSGTSLVQKKKLIAKLDDMIAEEEKQQAGIISVLKIYETLAADAKSDEMAKIKADSEKLEGTLKQSNEKLTSMRQSREKLEKEIAVIEREKNSREGDAALS